MTDNELFAKKLAKATKEETRLILAFAECLKIGNKTAEKHLNKIDT